MNAPLLRGRVGQHGRRPWQLVSDEKWSTTEQAVRDCLKDVLGDAVLAPDFELHAADLLAPVGAGPFKGLGRAERNDLALALLTIPTDRKHQVLLQVIHKSKVSATEPPNKDYGFDWKHPWDLALAVTLTVFEEYLRGQRTGSTSTGMVFIDHEEAYLELVRIRSKEHRDATGWRQLKKVMEIGYSAVSHANPMIQLVDLIAYTMCKHAESVSGYGGGWPPEAHEFLAECHARIHPRVQYKQLTFNKLNVPGDLVDHLKHIRKA